MYVLKLSTVQPTQRPKTIYRMEQSREDDKAMDSVDTAESPSAALTYRSSALQSDLRQIVRVRNACYCENMCQIGRWFAQAQHSDLWPYVPQG